MSVRLRRASGVDLRKRQRKVHLANQRAELCVQLLPELRRLVNVGNRPRFGLQGGRRFCSHPGPGRHGAGVRGDAVSAEHGGGKAAADAAAVRVQAASRALAEDAEGSEGGYAGAKQFARFLQRGGARERELVQVPKRETVDQNLPRDNVKLPGVAAQALLATNRTKDGIPQRRRIGDYPYIPQ